MAFADMVRRAVTTPITYAEREIFLTASIGLALHDPRRRAPRRRAEECRDRDGACQAPGRRPHRGLPADHARRPQRPLTLESDLRRALDRGEIKVLFKPIVRLEDRTIAGFEAVLRWDHPRLGRLRPEDFLPIAEETGLIVDLERLRARAHGARAGRLADALEVEPPIFASVNMSSRHLLRHDLLHDVKTVIARTGVMPGSLKLEMTERLVMENPEYSAQMLAACATSARPVARRFRHGLFRPLLSAALPLRHDQDRPVLRAPDGATASR